ncbi:MAG: hypothetical protein CMJ28_04810 [Phycisphaerae bacterium]|nr:hypothetical protein [Phycisphaerae bacterium]
MPDFVYVARNTSGQKQEGVVSAPDHSAALSELGDRGLVPIQVRERTRRRSRGRVGTAALARFYRQLADLLRSGVPMLRALRLLAKQSSNPRLAAAAEDVTQKVTEGAGLAESFARHDQIFTDVQCAMVRAGEQGNFLEDVLERIADNLEHASRLRSQVVGALVYPIILLLVGLGVVVVALTVLVPKFEGFLANGDALPGSTKLLLATSALLRADWPLIVVVLIGFIATVFVFRHHPVLRRVRTDWPLRIPLASGVIRAAVTARFARAFGTLLDNGIGLPQALAVSRDAAGHQHLSVAVGEALDRVKEGGSLVPPLADSGFLDPDTLEILTVAEESNTLAPALGRLAVGLERRVEDRLTLLMRLVEPILLLAMGGVVFFIFLSLVLPMLKMNSTVT